MKQSVPRNQTTVIDAEGFRPNVGIVICNGAGQVFWCRRFGQDSWQFPQGGIAEGESPEQAMYRELYEEVGLQPEHVKLLGKTKGWLRYRLPDRLVRQRTDRTCIGQKQKWFLLKLVADEHQVRFDTHEKPEFDGYQWVSYWYPVRNVVAFKRDVYRAAMRELLPALVQEQKRQWSSGRRRHHRRIRSQHTKERR